MWLYGYVIDYHAKNRCESLLFTLPCSQALVKPIKKENMKEESTPYARYEPAQTISVLLYSFNLPDFDYKNSVVCTRTQVHSGLACKTGCIRHKSKLSALVCTVFRDLGKRGRSVAAPVLPIQQQI